MVQSIENWTAIAGRVSAIAADSPLDGYKRVAVEVEHVAPVANFKSLVEASAGEIVDILVPTETAGNMVGGQRVSMRVRRAGRGIFAHPDETKLD